MNSFDRIKKIAQTYAVSIKVTYSEVEDSWYGEIMSAAKEENIEIKRICILSELIDYLEEHLEK